MAGTMARALRFSALLVLPAGCTTIHTGPGTSPVPDGIRVYPPRVYLFVDAEADGGKGRSVLAVVPNLDEPYDLKPVSFLARHEFRIDVEDGMVKALTSTQDTTAALSLVKSAAEMAAKAIGAGVSAAEPFEGHFGLASGIYLLKPGGKFEPAR